MFIDNAYAQAAGGPFGGDMSFIILMVAMFAFMYFIVIRPQQKRAKEHRTMLDGLQKGDEVVAAGLLGKVVKVSDAFVSLEIADNIVISVQKQAVTQLMPKGTIKGA